MVRSAGTRHKGIWPRCPACTKDLARDHWLGGVWNCINMDCPIYYRKYASKSKEVRIILEKADVIAPE